MFRYSIPILLLACASDFELNSMHKKNGHGSEADGTDLGADHDTQQDEQNDEDGFEAPNNEDAPDGIDEDETTENEEPPENDCEDTSDLIYAVDRDSQTLHLFDPPTASFVSLGQLNCGLFSGIPASMSVSRNGRAYLRYSSGSLYEVDLNSMECTETSYGGEIGAFGMGYATDSADTWKDQLYVASGTKLALMDTGDWSHRNLGQLPSQAELTGNGDGELWAFLPLEQPAELVMVDKENAETIDKIQLSGFPNPANIDTFALANWNGDFYVFIRSYGMGQSTAVHKVSADGQMTLVLADSGLNIVGAGVSTCAP